LFQSTAINRNQPQSTAINRNQPQSTAINRNQPQSTAINRRRQLPSSEMGRLLFTILEGAHPVGLVRASDGEMAIQVMERLLSASTPMNRRCKLTARPAGPRESEMFQSRGFASNGEVSLAGVVLHRMPAVGC
jgi:hypothetical protein